MPVLDLLVALLAATVTAQSCDLETHPERRVALVFELLLEWVHSKVSSLIVHA